MTEPIHTLYRKIPLDLIMVEDKPDSELIEKVVLQVVEEGVDWCEANKITDCQGKMDSESDGEYLFLTLHIYRKPAPCSTPTPLDSTLKPEVRFPWKTWAAGIIVFILALVLCMWLFITLMVNALFTISTKTTNAPVAWLTTYEQEAWSALQIVSSSTASFGMC